MPPVRSYRLVEIRKDRTRVVIATGLPMEMAARMQVFLEAERPET
jgi:hypothetical protein